jgi:uncharacterized protein (UPF0548 family)
VLGVTFTYPEVGATQHGRSPAGYRHVRVRLPLSAGPRPGADLERVGELLLTWQVHAAARVRLDTSAPVAAPGVRVDTRLGVGPLRLHEPCEVVWVERGPRRVGFGYGTLPGHALVGEELFAVERDGAGRLWWVVELFSRPAPAWLRPLAPALGVVQRLYAAWLARAARRLLARPA